MRIAPRNSGPPEAAPPDADRPGEPEFRDVPLGAAPAESAPPAASDGRLDVELSSPGTPGGGTNQEQLFAAGWSACFMSAIGSAAAQRKTSPPADRAIDAEVDLGTNDGGYALRARLNISLPGLDREVAQALVDAAHQIYPYSKASRGNIDVAIDLA
ncbi:MAG: Ohr family peroxiredoxin [Planctomycetaceae bacterium]|nr:Ohr family peroxiredoxin [Planctomycetaceae bacterium]